MWVKYECYYCHEHFEAKDRVDGFDKGYNEGFLCPSCGKNIKDNLMLVTRQNECQKKWSNRILWLLPFIFLSHIFNDSINIFGNNIELKNLVILISVSFAIIVLIFVPCTRRAGVFITKPVNNK